uniref:Znod1 n=1 Tax=Arundo donax TaxID=35708 RepID=A0A0A9R520_ARUDO
MSRILASGSSSLTNPGYLARRRSNPDPTEAPVLYCGCGRPAVQNVSGTNRNPSRSFLHCPVDPRKNEFLRLKALLMTWFSTSHSSTIEALQDQLKSSMYELESKDHQIRSLEAELMKNSGLFELDQSKGSIPEGHDVVEQKACGVWKLCLVFTLSGF